MDKEMEELREKLEKEQKFGRGIFNQIFEYKKPQLLVLLGELLEEHIKDDIIGVGCRIIKITEDDIPDSISIGGYGTLTIDWSGINYRGEHANENKNVVKFNKFFKLP